MTTSTPARTNQVTVAELQQLMQQLPRDAGVLIGVSDQHHFNGLLGELPVRAAAAVTGSAESALVLQVDGLS
ncbi:MAG: hypothetical protein WCG47_27825 [Dermatophilaceae bacterium]